MSSLEPVLVLDLFPEERTRLLDLLGVLTHEQWEAPTRCAGWSVKDVAAHLLADDLGRLSRQRDGYRSIVPQAGEDLVAFINRINAEWVMAACRLSPAIIIDLLRWSGEETAAYFASLDPFKLGDPVSWAGPEPAPIWLDLAREYTERWHHQQHIREAVGADGLYKPPLFAPVLATFVRSLPLTFRDAEAQEGTVVSIQITGESGGTWNLVQKGVKWELNGDSNSDARVTVKLGHEVAWRLFTKGLTRQEAEAGVHIDGDRRLGAVVLNAVAIIA